MKYVGVVLLFALVTSLGCSGDDPAANESVDSGAPTSDTGDTGPDLDEQANERDFILEIPETDRLTIEALQDSVHIVRTEADVPHIYASNENDLYVAMGWALARDRYFEYEIAWRFALGEVSSLLGRFGVSADIQSRSQGTHIVAERILEAMDEETGALFDAFASGINAYVDAAQAGDVPPPSEYELAAPLVGVEPAELLSRSDRRKIAAFAAFVVFQSSFTDNDLLRTLALEETEGQFDGVPLEALRQAGLRELVADTSPRHEIAGSEGFGLNGNLQTTLSLWIPEEVLPQPRMVAPIHPALRSRLLNRSETWQLWFGTRETSDKGSNAWALAPDQTPDGSVLLAGDGHLALGIPTLFFQMGADLRTFGDDPLRVAGLYLPGFPFLAVGTNGDIAWSQTYPRADVTDWYREEIQLDADGLPQSSRFEGAWLELVQIDEVYQVAGILGTESSERIIPRWTTDDGRLLVDIEGRTVEDPDDEVLADGESLVNMGGTWVVPSDLDDDGVITGITFDYTGFDIGNLPRAIESIQRADSVESFQEIARSFVGYAQNLIVADKSGKVGYTPYTAMPCRDYLTTDANGQWVEGADPRLLLDGTRFRGFEVLLDDEGRPDVEAGADDPQTCILPWDVYPRTVKETGFVVNANNDPHGGTFDGTFANDPFYIGGPWSPGYRAKAIVEGLEAVSGSADVSAMAEIQAHHRSQLGAEFGVEAIEAIESARTLQGESDASLEAFEIRLRDLYAQSPERLDEVEQRLQDWIDRGANAASGVETFYNQPTADDREDAVATMIFNAWFRMWIQEAYGDENIRGALLQPGQGRASMMRALRNLTEGRGPDNPLNLESWNSETEESVFFDDLSTPDATERSPEIAVRAALEALAFLESEPTSEENGGFGTRDMDAWLWGLRHRVVLDSILATFGGDNAALDVIAEEFAVDTEVLPLAEDFPNDDPRRRLRWFPRPGDFFNVDAANPGFFGDSFEYSDGPVMRMVVRIGPDGSVDGQNVIPGGQSGLNDSPHFADQAALWLGNEALPLRWSPADVAEGATGREVLQPTP